MLLRTFVHMHNHASSAPTFAIAMPFEPTDTKVGALNSTILSIILRRSNIWPSHHRAILRDLRPSTTSIYPCSFHFVANHVGFCVNGIVRPIDKACEENVLLFNSTPLELVSQQGHGQPKRRSTIR